MGRELFTNAVPSTVSGSINSSTTTVTVADGSSWPTGRFSVVCESEIMYCTSRSGDTLTVIRGTEGTTGASHSNGTLINASLTAGSLQAFRRDYLAAAGLVPNDDSLSSDDDEFDDENFSGWTAINNGTNVPVVTERNHRASIYLAGGGSNQLLQSWVKAKSPSPGDWVQVGWQNGRSRQYNIIGLIMANGATYNSGRQVSFQFSLEERQYFLREFTGYKSWNTGVNQIGGAANRYFQGVMHMRLVVTATNTYQCYMSTDGISWAALNAPSSAGSVGAITHMGFHISTWGGPDTVSSFLYCRFSF